MLIRHLTAADNVDASGSLIDTLAVRHGVVVGGRVAALAGVVDPLTHLNLDFDEHDLERCAVAERLEVGAAVQTTEAGLRFVTAAAETYRHLGGVDVQARRLA